jgi:hypothetical protein
LFRGRGKVPPIDDGVTFAHNITMSGGWHNGSKTTSFGLPFGIVSAIATTWFFLSCLHGHLPSQDAQAIFSGKEISARSISAPVASAATQSVALLGSDDDVDAVDSGIQDRGWSAPVAESSERKPDPAANPFLDSTPIHVAHRTPRRQQRAKHHQKIVHHRH